MAIGPAAGLAFIEHLDARGELRDYHLLAAARAELLARNGDLAAADQSYALAIEQCVSPVERAHLEARRAEVARP